MKTVLRLCLSLLLAGCANSVGYLPAGTNYGQITVGKPRISTRERLINDRLEEDAWLRAQLRETDNKVFGVQGKADIRSFTGLIARAGVLADSRQIKAYREKGDQEVEDLQRERELKNLDFQIALQKKQKELADTIADPTKGTSTYYGKGGDNSGGGTPPKQPAVSGETTKQLADLTKAYQDLQAQLTNLAGRPADKAGEPVTASVTASPIEEFRERLAYREEVRSELIQNALDDAHDLDGNTLYRLSFDTSIVPDNDSSAWAVITVNVKSPQGQVDPSPAQFANIVNQLIDVDANEVGLAVEDACRTSHSRSAAGVCLKGLRRDILNKLVLIDKNKAVQFLPNSTVEVRRFVTDDEAGALADSLVSAAAASGKYSPDVLGKGATALIRSHWIAALIGEGEDFRGPELFPNGKLRCRINYQRRLLGFWAPGNQVAVKKENVAAATVIRELYDPASERPLGYFEAGDGPDRCADGYLKVPDVRIDSRAVRQSRISAYGATPKESVQRISEVLSRREASEFALALQAVTGTAAVDTMLNYIRSNDALFHALRRQPLVVGFAGNPKSDAPANATQQDTSASFGWIIGPRFELRTDQLQRQRAGYRHTPIQNSVAGVISVPAVWRELDLEIEKCWKTETGDYQSCKTQTAKVSLPAEPLRAFDLANKFLGRTISISPLTPDVYTIRAGEAASLVIRGQNLWRNTKVLLGGQEADRLSVLPDMGGIVAHFKQVQPSGMRRDGRDPEMELVVSTSEGFIKVADVKIEGAEPAKLTQWTIPGNHLAFPGSKLTIKAAGQLPTAFHDVSVTLTNEDKRTSPVKVSDASVEYLVSADSVRITLPQPIAAWESGDRLQVTTLTTRFPADDKPDKQRLGEVIFYSSQEASKVGYVVVSKDKKRYDVELRFPVGFRDAYTVLRDRSEVPVFIIGKVDNNDDPVQKVCRFVSDRKLEKCNLSATFDKEPAAVRVRIGDGPDAGYPDVRLDTQ